MLKHKPLYLAFAFLQLGVVSLIGWRDTFSFVARGYTGLPDFLQAPAEKAETILAAGLGEGMDPAHPVRQLATVYSHMAGTDTGYAFFAPNVPNAYRLVFELHYPDGRVEYDLPRVTTKSAGLRFAVLLDHIGRTRSDELREVMVKMVASSVWREHPEATMVRAVFGTALLPTAEEFRRGTRESSQFLYAYDFVFGPEDAPPP